MKKKPWILIVSLILLSMFSIVPSSSSEVQAYLEIRQLTKNDFDDYYGSGGYAHDHVLSWDGSKVVFSTKYSEYDWKLYVMNTTDSPGQEKLMTTAPGCNVWGSISTAGNKIVFGSNRDNPSDWWYSFEIFVMNTTDDPGDEVQITYDNLLDHMPDISGNGEIIAWHSAPTSWTGFDIVVANISDMNDVSITRLPTGPKEDECPSLTYDGEFLSFWGGIGHSGDVFIINSNGTGLRNLTSELGTTTPEQSCAISGDGSKVAFPRIVDGDYEIFVYDIAQDKFTQLTDNEVDDILGGINGDGTIVTYSRNGHIFINDMTVETQLTDGNFDDKWPRISGDGNVIVFLSNRDGPDDDVFLLRLQEQISASVDIDPDTLNLKSNGQWITAYITLPEGHNVEDIVLETVYLDGIPAVWSEIQNGVYMAKFDRATVQTCLTSELDYDSAPKSYDLTLLVTGELLDGTPFEGSDTIRVLSK